MAITRGAAGPAACGTGGTASVDVTYAGLTAGRGLVIAVIWYHATATLSSVTIAGETNATIIAGSLVRNAAVNNVAIQLAFHKSLATSASKLITANFSVAVDASSIFAQEYQGQDTVDFYDTAVNTGTGNGADSSITVTTNTANDLIAACNVNNGGGQTAGVGFTLVNLNVCFWWEGFEDDVDVGAAGAKTVPWVHPAGDWANSAAGFKPGAAIGAQQFMVATQGLSRTGGMIGRDYI